MATIIVVSAVLVFLVCSSMAEHYQCTRSLMMAIGVVSALVQKFNSVKYQACGLYTSADKAYYDGFVAGCMQVGNTKLICETVANSNTVAPTAQTQTATQPTQAIQPAVLC